MKKLVYKNREIDHLILDDRPAVRGVLFGESVYICIE